jgi:methionine sulfoxide reductase heme-binding subunit
MQKILDSRLALWVLMMAPTIPMVAAVVSGRVDDEGRLAYEFLLHPTGEFAARFMLFAMALTPLRLLFPNAKFVRWLLQRRRYFGLAAFVYAVFHTILYLVDMGNLQSVLGEFWSLGIWSGWLAMFIFTPLAFTSNDRSVRYLGLKWKRLQRLIYVAAAATLLHWIFVHNNIGAAILHFAPILGLEIYRVLRWQKLSQLEKYSQPKGTPT